jgi:hypothetical protein
MQGIEHGDLSPSHLLWDKHTNVLAAVGWSSAQLGISSCSPDEVQRVGLVDLQWDLGFKLPQQLTSTDNSSEAAAYLKQFLETYVPNKAKRVFLQGVLNVDPDKRWSITQALEDDYIKSDVKKVSCCCCCCCCCKNCCC